MKKKLALPVNYFHNTFPGSNFLLPPCFQVENLLLATVNFEHVAAASHNYMTLTYMSQLADFLVLMGTFEI